MSEKILQEPLPAPDGLWRPAPARPSRHAPGRLLAMGLAVALLHAVLLLALVRWLQRPAAQTSVFTLMGQITPAALLAPVPATPVVKSAAPSPPTRAQPQKPTPAPAAQAAPAMHAPVPAGERSVDQASGMEPVQASASNTPSVASVAATWAQPGAAPQADAVVPPSVRLRYVVKAASKHYSLDGYGDLLWRVRGTEYDIRFEIGGAFVRTRTQHSVGHITEQGLSPRRFSDKSRQEEATHFEPEKGRVSFSNNHPDVPWVAGMQDRLSVLLQLSAQAAGAPQRMAPGTAVTLRVAGTRDADDWTFTVEDSPVLQLPGATVPTLHLQRLPRKPYDQKLEVWLAPALDYLPVRLRLTYANGDVIDQQWASTDRL